MKTHVFESPIEERLLTPIIDRIGDTLDPRTQVPVVAHGVRFRVDFMVEAAGRRVVIECDGKDFHEFWSDRRRDLLMLDSGAATDVIRFTGSDIFFDAESCIGQLNFLLPFVLCPSGNPHDFKSMVLAAESLKCAKTSPILRSIFPLSQVPVRMDSILDSQCTIIIGKIGIRHEAVAQFKSPQWKRGYNGVKTWSMADLLGCANDPDIEGIFSEPSDAVDGI